MRQKEKVLLTLQRKGYLTAALAANMGIKNLRARITELRQDGHEIQSEKQERIAFVNSKGQRHMQAYRVAKYSLKSQNLKT